MTARTVLQHLTLAAAVGGSACSSATQPTPTGDVTITIEQALTGATTSQGTFIVSGALSDAGQTTEELTFGGALTDPVVPVTFRRTLTGKRGTMTVSGAATLTWTSPTTGTLAGNWKIETATGDYVKGDGTLSGSANFGATPPVATLTYRGVLRR